MLQNDQFCKGKRKGLSEKEKGDQFCEEKRQSLSEKEKDEEVEVYLILATFGRLVVSYKY